MKFFPGILLLLTVVAQRPTVEYSYVTTTGELAAFNIHQLTLTGAVLGSIAQSGLYPFEAGDIGHVTFTTPRFVTGSTQTGGTFDAGGSFNIAMDSIIEPGVQFNGTFVNGAWTRDFLADGTSNYVFTAHVKGSITLQDGTTHNALGLVTYYSLNQGTDVFNGPQLCGGGTVEIMAGP